MPYLGGELGDATLSELGAETRCKAIIACWFFLAHQGLDINFDEARGLLMRRVTQKRSYRKRRSMAQNDDEDEDEEEADETEDEEVEEDDQHVDVSEDEADTETEEEHEDEVEGEDEQVQKGERASSEPQLGSLPTAPITIDSDSDEEQQPSPAPSVTYGRANTATLRNGRQNTAERARQPVSYPYPKRMLSTIFDPY